MPALRREHLKILTRLLILITALAFASACSVEEEPGGGSDTASNPDTISGDAGDTGAEDVEGDGATFSCVDQPDPSATCESSMDCPLDLACLPVDCVPSTCSCDPVSGAWGCTADCRTNASQCQAPTTGGCDDPDPSLGTCVEDADCSLGEQCSGPGNGTCSPSSCSCDAENNAWICTADCGPTCIPMGSSCEADTDCTEGQEWCIEASCEPCDNSGQLCDIACPEGWEMPTRNGCSPCECVPSDDCQADSDCPVDQQCVAGDLCTHDCPVGDPACCHGNSCQTISGQTPCETDADCAEGQQWCIEGSCEPCDNSGAACDIACAEGYTTAPTRHGCTPCECVPEQESCTSDADCANNTTCVAGDLCYDWCAFGDPACCYNNSCQ